MKFKNDQLDPTSPEHLRSNPTVQGWIDAYWKENRNPTPADCSICGWPHRKGGLCGMGQTFGCVQIGRDTYYIDTSNVAWTLHFMETLGSLGFHWRDHIFVKRREDKVVISHFWQYNNCPQPTQWVIPVNEFASIVCAGSVEGETSERYNQALAFLGVAPAEKGSAEVKPDRMLWIEEYKCGCSFVGVRHDLPGYCPRHGENGKNRQKIGKESEQNMNLKRGLAP